MDISPEQMVKYEEVLDLLKEGESLRKSAEAAGLAASTVLRRVKLDPIYAEHYARAREIGYSLLAEELLAISDEREVEVRYDGEDVKLDLSNTAVARNRLRIDTRKWVLSKMLPKIYGDKLELSGDPTSPIQTITRLEIVPLK